MDNSRTSKSIKNIAFSIGNQLLSLILSFVSRTVFLSVLSVEYLGISGLFGDIFSMLSLADLGLGTAMSYSMYKPLAENDYERLAGLTTLYKKVYRVIALVVSGVGLALVPFLRYLVKLETDMPQLELYYLLALANCVSSYLVVYKTSIVGADQRGYLITKYTSIFHILRTISTTVILLITRNYVAYLVMGVAFTYFTNFFNSHIAEKNYPYINKKVQLPRSEIRDIFGNLKSVFLYKISSVLINATDNTLISVIVSTAAVGFYSNYMIAVSKVSGIVNTIFYSLTASLGNLIAKEDEKRRFEIFQIMQSVSLIISTFCVTCIFCLEEDFIRIWLGEEYLLDKTVLLAVVINFYFTVILLPIWVFREATGLYRKTKYVMLCTAIVNLISSVILGKWIGLAGILLGTSFSRLVTYFWYEPVLLFKKYFGKSSVIYFRDAVKSICVTAVIMIGIAYCSNRFYVSDWWDLILKAIAVGGSSLLLVVLIFHRTEGFRLIHERIRKMIGTLKIRGT